ncbi:tRNA modification GTPase MnmE [uncultured Defluviicoccus sp.]|uniref:tRNA modification GTPase MnmE n=1 Tax=metagenome TaxID=256318 RepID=A0A380T9R7_9ZZZZ|nr:tRNA modification GTPase MnmE [uncultured Defluviicoccus sp.]
MPAATIFALASGAGRAGVAVIRISGPGALRVLESLSGQSGFRPRNAKRVELVAAEGERLDSALALWFPAPNSFTGEDVAELHVHGGRAVVADVLAALGRCDGLRVAEAGEFTRRAVLNGKMDLTQAEGLADLVAAETPAQRRQALRQADGGLRDLYESWRARLVRLQAHVEAGIDFADEDAGAGDPTRHAAIATELARLGKEIGDHLADAGRGERLREGVRVALVGAVNAGKSSLLNALVRREAAIVSPHAGTTRDVIEVAVDLDGYPVVFADTAGLRNAPGDVEAEGVRRARAWAAAADLKLVVFDGAVWPEVDAASLASVDGNTLVVISKADLRAPTAVCLPDGSSALAVSAVTGVGLGSLLDALRREIAARFAVGEAPVLTRARHRQALEQCAARLEQAGGAAEALELQAEDVRAAADALGRITGRVDIEQLLDVVFRDFCIGK